MGITLDTINEALHAIAIKDSANGYELSIDSNGKLSCKIEDNGNSITVDAVNLDIRDLTSASDSVAAVQSGTWDIGTLTSITNDVNIADGGNSITVDASQLDIDDLEYATDSVTAHQGGTWTIDSITNDVNVTQGTSPWVVSATDLDIRDLDGTNDSVNLFDGTNALSINADGSLNVVGDIEVTSSGYDTWKVSTATVTATESELVATPLTGRLNVIVQNLGSSDCYLKEATGVTSANGLMLSKGSSFEAMLDDGANLFAITASGSTDIRIAEFSA